MKVHKIRLLDNNYEIVVANQLVKKCIEAKIDFIQERLQESNTITIEETERLKSRINELNAEMRSLDLFMERYDGEDVELEIGATIVMSVKQPEYA